MIVKRFSIQIILRISLIVANVLVFAWIFGDMRLFFNQVILALVLVGQITELIHFVNHTNRELARLFMAIRHSDFSITFRKERLGKSFEQLQDSLTEIIAAYKVVKIEKEAQYHLLQMLIRQINVGIISLEGDTLALINPTAEQLLGISGLKSWKLISQLNPELTAPLEQLGSHGRKLMEIRANNTTRMVSVDVSTLIILDKPHKIITLQDINSEIEQKEIEAWHKLIRILTHEIMNSVTPISSLTETMQSMLSDRDGKQKALPDLNEETIGDIRFSLKTIHRRTESLLEFVENYRALSKVPRPVPEQVDVPELLHNVKDLMSHTLTQQSIDLVIDVEPSAATILLDPMLIEQVLINLVTNSTHALEGRSPRTIILKAYTRDRSQIIEVTDNGKGIPEKEMKEIFVPFFSTKKNGSGIGLSLSKQIMSLHGGNIKASSVVGEGTSFYLRFRPHVPANPFVFNS